MSFEIPLNSYIQSPTELWKKKHFNLQAPPVYDRKVTNLFSPPARWGLLDFMSIACSSPPLLSSSPPPPAQPRPSTHSVLCRTATTTIHAQGSLPDLNHDHPRPVFPAGPQPRPSTPSVPCRTSTASIHAKCSLPDLM